MLFDILSLIYMLAFAAAGLVLARELFFGDNTIRRIVYGLAAGLMMLIWLPALFSFVMGFTLAAQILALITALSIALAAKLIRAKKRQNTIPLDNKSDKGELRTLILTAAPIVLIGIILHLNHTIVPASNGSLHVGQCTYGDLCMHLGFITSISTQKAFPPEYSLLPGTAVGYPFLCDSVSSTFYTLGASLRTATILPAVYAHITVVLGVYLFFNTWFKSKKTAVIATYIFFIGGGIGFMYIYNNRLILLAEGVDRVKDMFAGFYLTPTNMPAEGLRWVNAIADMLLPQRATLFGWALLFPALELLHRAAIEKTRRLFIPLGIVAGSLPLIHTHSFVALGMVSVFLFVTSLTDMLVCAKHGENARTAATVAGFFAALAALAVVSFLPLAETKDGIARKMQTSMAILLGALALIAAGAGLVKSIKNKRGITSAAVLASIALIIGAASAAAIRAHSAFAVVVPLAGIAAVVIFTLAGGQDPKTAGDDELRSGLKHLGYFALFGVIAVAIAAPQLFLFTFKQSADSSSFLRWNFNWDNNSDGFLWFYIKNLGLIFVLMPIAFIWLKRKQRRFYGGALLIWAVCEMLLFQPNPYDNNKLLFIWFAMTCGIVAHLIAETLAKRAYLDGGERLDIRRTAVRFAALAVALIVMMLSGVLTLLREYVSADHYTLVKSENGIRVQKVEKGYELTSRQLVDLAAWVNENTPEDAMFLTHNNHNNVIAMLTGRDLFCGSGTFLHWHGINYRERANLIGKMYSSPSEYLFACAEEYGIDYVLISSYETGSYNVDRAWFENNLSAVYSEGNVVLYRIERP
ncbi:MAG: hypothetical protein IKS90_02420 [Clostridia bacterium]|nr:hypothetical protein [Clostridia bacterium]